MNFWILRHKKPTGFGVSGRIHDIGYTPNGLWRFTPGAFAVCILARPGLRGFAWHDECSEFSLRYLTRGLVTSYGAVVFRRPLGKGQRTVEVSKALAALQPLYGKPNIEVVTTDGRRVRGIVHSLKTTQALTTPSVKIECADGEIVKIPFPAIAEIRDRNRS